VIFSETNTCPRHARLQAQEATIALAAGQRLYGREFADLSALAQTFRADPESRFSSADDVRSFIIATAARARARAAQVVSNPPSADIDFISYPEATAETSPGGQYVPADDGGTRKAVHYYRADYQHLARSQLEATIFHETWPDHHLQQIVTRERVRTGAHRIARLVYVPGFVEGWATYVEGLARKLPLYNSDLSTIGSVMGSQTPGLVADIGMHVLGWSEQQTFDYLQDHHPAMPEEIIQRTVDGIGEDPGSAVPYAMGGMEIEAIRGKRETPGRLEVRSAGFSSAHHRGRCRTLCGTARESGSTDNVSDLPQARQVPSARRGPIRL